VAFYSYVNPHCGIRQIDFGPTSLSAAGYPKARPLHGALAAYYFIQSFNDDGKFFLRYL